MQEEIEMIRKNIASKLRGLRAEKNCSQKELSLNTGLDIATIARYESGNTTQSLDKLLILSKYYQVNLLYFFNQNYENMYRIQETKEE